MAEYPTRQFSASQAYNAYMQSLEEEEERKKAYNIVHQMHKLTNPHYSGSSAETSNLSKISKLGAGTSAGLATRLRLMTAADKENLGVEFTGAFQQALESDLFTSLASFNTWANKQGPWYDEDLRRKHATTVKDLLAAQQSNRVAEAVDTLFAEYNDEWVTGSYTEQNQVRQNIADSDAIKNLPSKWRATAMDEVIKMLNSFLSPTGQYAADEWQMKKDKWTATQKKTEDDLEKERDATNRKNIARSGAYRLFEYMKTAEEAPGIGLGLSFNDAKDKVTEEMEGTVWDRKEFDDMVKTLREEVAPKLQTETYYDPELQDYVLATEEEARAEGLLPEKVGARLQPQLMSRHNAEDRFWLDAGDELKREGVLSRDIFEFYRRHARRVDDPREQDSEIIRIWKARKKKLEAEAKAVSPSIIFQTATGALGGQTDDGISNVRIKPTNQ